jgi:hypothetical protein
LQDVRGTYTLGPVTESIFSNVTQIISRLVARTNAAEEYLSFGSIHPLYIQVKTLVRYTMSLSNDIPLIQFPLAEIPWCVTILMQVCCKGVDMLGNWWLALFIAASFGFFVSSFMLAIIRRLDQLPPKGCDPYCCSIGRANLVENVP